MRVLIAGLLPKVKCAEIWPKQIEEATKMTLRFRLLILPVFLLLPSVSFAQQSVTCASDSGGHRVYCAADTRGGGSRPAACSGIALPAGNRVGI
jgi:hypothetical protein